MAEKRFPKTGVNFELSFATPGVHPYEEIKWDIRKAEIKDGKGNVIFEQEAVEVPHFWSQTATNIVAQKYFWGRLGTPEREHSVRQLVDRVADLITRWGEEGGYFDGEESARNFNWDLKWLMVNQYGCFNSPALFNLGVNPSRTGYWWDPITKKARVCTESEDRKYQTAACYLVPVEDDMESIAHRNTVEMRIFKDGSGCGTNNSKIRSSRERITGGGYASGPVSFMSIYDSSARCTKSGGRSRRAAKLERLDAHHPDILEFIQCKYKEEKKAHALIREGYEANFNGEAYSTVCFQNSNLSVGVTDKFMGAAEEGKEWQTLAVTTGTPYGVDGARMPSYNASGLLDEIALGTWRCGDPGLQFDDAINRWHTVPNHSRINTSNPCQPGFATVLTPEGIRTFDDINVGDTIWSGSRWTTIVRKIATGTKPVWKYETTAGRFVGTEDHRVISEGVRIQAGKTKAIDVSRGPRIEEDFEPFDPADVTDGWVFGEGSVHKASNDLVYLNVGENDGCVHEALAEKMGRHRPGIKNGAWEVQTTLLATEVPLTYLRSVPERFYRASATKKRGFLRGLYAANGSVCGGRVTLKAASLEVVQQVQEMLSSLGIPAYYTVNKPKTVQFGNGKYECRHSYDLNITHGRREFARLIGFVHPDKKARLEKALAAPQRSWSKETYKVVGTEFLGEFPVFDITVEAEEHTYWTGGLLVSNCGEYLHVDSSACNLASLNLLKFRTPDGDFDVQRFRKAVKLIFTAQEISVHNNGYPTPEIAENSYKLRPLGLGYSNLGSLLMSFGLPYDSEEGRDMAAAITAILTGHAYVVSATHAENLGAFEFFEANRTPMLKVMSMHLDAAKKVASRAKGLGKALAEESVKTWEEATSKGERHGYRNSQASVIAPTGSISFMMDCDTTGIEPDIAIVKYKKLAGRGDLKLVNGTVPLALRTLGYDEAQISRIITHIDAYDTIEDFQSPNGDILKSGLNPKDLPVFDCAFPPAQGTEKRSIHWTGHVKILAASQPFVSGALSKTVNMPSNSTVSDIKNAYSLAWKLGCKDIAIYRDNSKGSQPLSTKKEGVEETPACTCDPLKGEGCSNCPKDSNTPQKVACIDPKKGVEGWLDDSSTPLDTVKAGEASVKGGRATPYRERLPTTRSSVTHKFEIGNCEGYITVGLYGDGRPGELFLTCSREGSTISGLLDALGTLVSMGLQYGIPLEVLTKKFIGARFEPSGFTRNPELPMAKSIVDYVFRWLESRFSPEKQTGENLDSPESKGEKIFSVEYEEALQEVINGNFRGEFTGNLCPRCGMSLRKVGTCDFCVNCQYSGGCG